MYSGIRHIAVIHQYITNLLIQPIRSAFVQCILYEASVLADIKHHVVNIDDFILSNPLLNCFAKHEYRIAKCCVCVSNVWHAEISSGFQTNVLLDF